VNTSARSTPVRPAAAVRSASTGTKACANSATQSPSSQISPAPSMLAHESTIRSSSAAAGTSTVVRKIQWRCSMNSEERESAARYGSGIRPARRSAPRTDPGTIAGRGAISGRPSRPVSKARISRHSHGRHPSSVHGTVDRSMRARCVTVSPFPRRCDNVVSPYRSPRCPCPSLRPEFECRSLNPPCRSPLSPMRDRA
jgi:hypothetical protein